MSDNEQAESGISFLTVLFLIFLTLKLTGYITWSWWYVTMPLWAGIVIVVAIAGIVVAIAAFVDWCKK